MKLMKQEDATKRVSPGEGHVSSWASGLGVRDVLRVVVWVGVIVTLFFPLSGYANEDSQTISAIKVEGNRRIEESAVKFALESKVGQSYSLIRLRRDIQKLYELGYFKDIRIDAVQTVMGVELTYQVVENPTIEKIVILGNEKIKTSDLEEKLSLRLHSILDRGSIQDGIQRMKKHYESQGYYFVVIEQHLKDLVGNQVALEFRIKEGGKLKIEKIAFEGNRSFSSKQLKGVIMTKEKGLISSILGKDLYREDMLKMDGFKIEGFYHNHGYIDVQIGEPRLNIQAEQEKAQVVIPIKEGSQYRVGKLVFNGDDVYKSEDISRQVVTRGGVVFDRSLLQKDIERITDLYALKGYAFAEVDPVTQVDKASKTINIGFEIDKGEKVYIGQINITGNTKTQDKVARRELPLQEGEIFNSKLAKLSKNQLEGTGYFENVEITPRRRMGEKGVVDLEVKLDEKPTGNITFGGGFSTSSSLLGTAGVEQNNLFGTGLKANLGGQMGGRYRRFALGLTQPYFMDLPITAGTNLFSRNTEFPNFDARKLGTDVTVGKHLFEYVRANVGVKLERIGLKDVDWVAFIPVDQFGRSLKDSRERWSVLGTDEVTTTTSLFTSLSRNTLDNPIFPTGGSRINLSTELGGGLGDNQFYKGEFGASKFFSMAFLERYLPTSFWQGAALMLKTEQAMGGGFGDTHGLPIFERFFLGGDNTLRGYDYEDVGPKGFTGEAIGGDYSSLLSAEFIFPIPLSLPYVKALKGDTFFDMGDLFARGDAKDFFNPTSYRKSTGLGVRVLTPMGPVRLDWAYRLDDGEKRDDRDRDTGGSSKFHFGFGSSF